MRNAQYGLQVDPTDTNTDCAAKTGVVISKMSEFGNKILTWSIDDIFAPLYVLSENTVAFTDIFSNCYTTNFAKQFSVRMNSLSGFFDFVSSIGVAFLKETWRSNGAPKSPLY